MSNIKVKTDIELMKRQFVLHYVTSELAQGFGIDEISFEVIKKGILDRQLIQSIYICYSDKQNALRGKIILDIDWETYEVLAKTEEGAVFRVDPEKSIQDQVSEVYGLIVNYTEELRSSLDIAEVYSVFVLIEEIRNDDQRLKEALAFLDLYAMDEEEWHNIQDKKYDAHMKFKNAALKELNILVDHDKF